MLNFLILGAMIGMMVYTTKTNANIKNTVYAICLILYIILCLLSASR